MWGVYMKREVCWCTETRAVLLCRGEMAGHDGSSSSYQLLYSRCPLLPFTWILLTELLNALSLLVVVNDSWLLSQ